jgi:nucleoside-triphosphatase THEP1
LLAAIVYEPGFPIDELVLAIAQSLRSEGVRLGGVAQENAARASCAAMTLIDLATGERFSISQDLGAEARGCRLDPRGLADVASRIDAAAGGDLDLLLLNKFGKAEAEGSGLRNALAHAVAAGTPVLSSVRKPYLDAWSRFHGGLAAELPPCFDAVLAWCRRAIVEAHLRRAEASAISA